MKFKNERSWPSSPSLNLYLKIGKIFLTQKKEREIKMPLVSMFFGIIIQMYFFDTKQHHLPPSSFPCKISRFLGRDSY
jgi:hypothetical protein